MLGRLLERRTDCMHTGNLRFTSRVGRLRCDFWFLGWRAGFVRHGWLYGVGLGRLDHY